MLPVCRKSDTIDDFALGKIPTAPGPGLVCHAPIIMPERRGRLATPSSGQEK
jgi:hypothetical protein